MPYIKCPFASCPNFGSYCRRLHAPEEAAPRQVDARKAEYKKAATQLRAAGGDCQINSPVCVRRPVNAHHPYGRTGKNMVRELMLACNPCNQYIEDHPAWAKERGFKKSKHEPNYKRQK
jgi:hypothetical protein